MEIDSETVVLKADDLTAINSALAAAWLKKIEAAKNFKSIVFDFSLVTNLKLTELACIVRKFKNPARVKNWKLVLIGSAQAIKLVESEGLSDLFQCFEVHGKAPPSKKVVLEGAADNLPRTELSLVFGHLVACVERVSETLFGAPCSYQAPIGLLTDLSGKFPPDIESVLVRAESASLVYRAFFLMRDEHKAELAKIVFKGRQASAGAIRDLLPELANIVFGQLTSQLKASGLKFEGSKGIPEVLAPMALPAEPDLKLMKGLAQLNFYSGQIKLTLIIGYSLKC